MWLGRRNWWQARSHRLTWVSKSARFTRVLSVASHLTPASTLSALARPKFEIEARCAIGPIGKFGKCRCLKTRSPADVQIECGSCPVQQPHYGGILRKVILPLSSPLPARMKKSSDLNFTSVWRTPAESDQEGENFHSACAYWLKLVTVSFSLRRRLPRTPNVAPEKFSNPLRRSLDISYSIPH